MTAAWSSTEGSGGGMVRHLVGLGKRLVEGHTFIVDTFEDRTFFPLPPLELLPSLPSPISLSLPSREAAKQNKGPFSPLLPTLHVTTVHKRVDEWTKRWIITNKRETFLPVPVYVRTWVSGPCGVL